MNDIEELSRDRSADIGNVNVHRSRLRSNRIADEEGGG
jgi:hypothetical protein